jgi:hypothetical protein
MKAGQDFTGRGSGGWHRHALTDERQASNHCRQRAASRIIGKQSDAVRNRAVIADRRRLEPRINGIGKLNAVNLQAKR